MINNQYFPLHKKIVCYMNSQLQQLYMIPSFRKAVLEVDDLHYEVTPREDNILYHLKVYSYQK